MKELVEVIAKALVDNPEEVVVTESMKGEDTLIELKVSPADMGKVFDSVGGGYDSHSQHVFHTPVTFLWQ